jgi:hypothetical protein
MNIYIRIYLNLIECLAAVAKYREMLLQYALLNCENSSNEILLQWKLGKI